MGSDRRQTGVEQAEQREATRLRARDHPSEPGQVNFIADGEAGQGVLHDISLSGARIEGASRAVATGVVVDLYFLFGRGQLRQTHAVGEVVRATKTSFAVRFSQIEPELERLILARRPRPLRFGSSTPAGYTDAEAGDSATAQDRVQQLPETVLRSRYERSRTLSPEEQIRECVEYIGNPEILTFEFLESFTAIERSCGPNDVSFWRSATGADGNPEEIILGHFYESLEVTVLAPEPYGFTCLASQLSPLGQPGGASVDDPSGLDYLALVQGPHQGLALGVTPWLLEYTPYSLFMRILNCFAELAPVAQIERINREFLNGRLESPPSFDLHLVLSHGVDTDESLALAQLTRDLAEKLKALLNEAPQFPNLLRDVMCLRLDESAFVGRLDLDWRV